MTRKPRGGPRWAALCAPLDLTEVMAVALTEKQRRFVDYYVKTANATQAAIKAGYSERTAAQTGARLLRNVKIASAVEERNKQLESDRIADMIEVKEFWSSVMRDDNVAVADRLKASEFIARTNAAFTERVAHSGDVAVKIVDDIE